MTESAATPEGTVWRDAARRLAGSEATLVSLWGDEGAMRMALIDGEGRLATLRIACVDDRFPSVGALHAPAIRLERAACDLFGFVAEDATDARPWLDHGRWPLTHPLGAASPREGAPPAYPFLNAEGPGLHQIPVGPVHAGIIEPGHFRFHASGEAVVRLEERLGYVHKGVDRLTIGASLADAAKVVGRVSGDSTVAYSIAFARAAEAIAGVAAPARAVWLRGLMAEMERLANHFGDIGAICNDASFALMHAHCSVLRERVVRAAETAFGHRLMMDAVVPGGVAADLTRAGEAAIHELHRALSVAFPPLMKLYDNTASLQDRTVATGVLTQELARRFGAGGVVGRASGRPFDARRAFPYAPYDALRFEVPGRREGDVNARVWVRIDEVFESLSLIEQILAALPDGPTRVELRPGAGEGLTFAEAFRGDVFCALRLGADGRVARCHLRDASWFQWPLLEAAIEGNIVADFPLCNKSFNCSYSGVDL